jgi:hypothetical protein
MSPDLLFWLALALKMAVTAGFVLVATYAAERAGPVVGAMIATLPIAAGPAYIFLAFDHDAHFIANSALASLVVNVVTSVFALVYAALAQRHGRAMSVLPALATWALLAFAVRSVPWTTLTAVIFNVIGIAACVVLGNRFRHVRVPPPRQYWTDLVLRAAMVAVLVATVVSASSIVGPTITGILAVFPIVLLSLMLILHDRIGGPAAAAVLSNSLLGMAGFSASCLTAHLIVERIGTAAGLTVALAVSVACNLGFWWLRRRQAAAVVAAAGR